MIRLLLMAAAFLLLAPMARAQVPFSCDPGFEDRFHSGLIDTELRDWIADTAKRFAKARAALFWQHLPRDMYPCADLSCLSDEQIVARVARQCTAEPRVTLERAAEDITSVVTSTFRGPSLEQRAAPLPNR
jgi:hypothetical protein